MDGHDYLTHLDPVPHFFVVWTNGWDNTVYREILSTFENLGASISYRRPPAGFVIGTRKPSIITFWQLKHGPDYPKVSFEKFTHNDKRYKLERRQTFAN